MIRDKFLYVTPNFPIVRDPVTYRALPQKGDANQVENRKPNTSYWRRRIKSGDVECVPGDSLRELPKSSGKTTPPRPPPKSTMLRPQPPAPPSEDEES